jgi:glutamine synthetase
MPGTLTLKELQEAVAAGEIDTVVVCFPDMQGRLVGKRFHAEFFLGGAYEETHGCDYLLANDIDMEPVPGYAVANCSIITRTRPWRTARAPCCASRSRDWRR